MKISSNYYDYYSQYAQFSALTNTQVSTADSNASQNEVEKKTTSSISKIRSLGNSDATTMNLNLTNRAMLRSTQMKDEDSSEMRENMEKIKGDMEAIKTADIDTMSAEDVKTMITKLKTDMTSMPKPDEEVSDNQDIDLETMSAADLKSLLKEIQAHEQNKPMMVGSQIQGGKSSDVFAKVKEDMDSIKIADIDALSVDGVKELLSKLKTDMDSIQNPYEKSTSVKKTDIASMSEEEMRTMLKKIQEQAKSMSTMGPGGPPPPKPEELSDSEEDGIYLNSNNEAI